MVLIRNALHTGGRMSDAFRANLVLTHTAEVHISKTVSLFFGCHDKVVNMNVSGINAGSLEFVLKTGGEQQELRLYALLGDIKAQDQKFVHHIHSAGYTLLRLLLGFSDQYSASIDHWDFITAFLLVNLKNVVYITKRTTLPIVRPPLMWLPPPTLYSSKLVDIKLEQKRPVGNKAAKRKSGALSSSLIKEIFDLILWLEAEVEVHQKRR
ncbi:hypothetical protein MP228_012634 [Amoeboaphelidium protococcarum]|nr:hypothetical protein MP228_012634 [Amoeboaphelidium protococcarum]